MQSLIIKKYEYDFTREGRTELQYCLLEMLLIAGLMSSGLISGEMECMFSTQLMHIQKYSTNLWSTLLDKKNLQRNISSYVFFLCNQHCGSVIMIQTMQVENVGKTLRTQHE